MNDGVTPARTTLTLGYSPCPNDTFIFHALVHGLTATPLGFRERLEDVETLNRLVLAKALDVSKISYHLLGHVREEYCLLSAGGALGRGCGPLVVAPRPIAMEELRGKRIAIPGQYTTAALLLRLFDPSLTGFAVMPFDRIMAAVAEGEVEAGLIIHESRFTYHQHGLVQLLDLGEWWEEETGQPIPLGGIVARRSLGRDTVAAIDRGIRSSVEHALKYPQSSADYIRTHSQEMAEEVCAAHISLYVNEFSRNLGDEGRRAVEILLRKGEEAGLFPPSSKDIFIP